jgi:hypothetical protein
MTTRYFLGAAFCITSCFLLIWNAVQHDSLTGDEQVGLVVMAVLSFAAATVLFFV